MRMSELLAVLTIYAVAANYIQVQSPLIVDSFQVTR